MNGTGSPACAVGKGAVHAVTTVTLGKICRIINVLGPRVIPVGAGGVTAGGTVAGRTGGIGTIGDNYLDCRTALDCAAVDMIRRGIGRRGSVARDTTIVAVKAVVVFYTCDERRCGVVMETRGRVEVSSGCVSVAHHTTSVGGRNLHIPVGRTGGVATGGDTAGAGIISIVEDH